MIWKLPLLLLLMVVGTVYTFVVPDPRATGAGGFMNPGLARIIFWHLPAAWVTSVLVLLCTYLGWRYLATRKPIWDIRLSAAFELTAVFGVLTMLTGILFSRVQWNAWWSNDPRQTSFLMVLLMVAAGLALRAGIIDEGKRALACAGYAVAIVVPVVFLTFVYPRLPQVTSLHPSVRTIEQARELFDIYTRAGVLTMTAAFGLAANLLYHSRVRLGMVERRLEEFDERNRFSSDDPAAVGVVRPVVVSSRNRGTSESGGG